MARMRKMLVGLFVMAAMLLPTLATGVTTASAQAGDDVFETCSAVGWVLGSGGQGAADAASALLTLSAPNPPGIDVALQTIIEAESNVAPSGSRPSAEGFQSAQDALQGYYGGICAAVDICPLIRQAVATNDGSSAEAARLARGLTAPAPPGIDAALALISGAVTTSPFHNTVAEAQAQIASFFPCDASGPEAPTGNGGDTGGDTGSTAGETEDTTGSESGGGQEIAFTGAETLPLAVAGATMIGVGGLLLAARRRLPSH